MNIEEIRSLPVADIADDDCILFLWIKFPCLLEGIYRLWKAGDLSIRPVGLIG